jgi:peroxiredoxin
VVVVLAVGVITWVVVAGSDDGGSSSTVIPAGVRDGGPRVGDAAPDFSLSTLDGKTVRLSDYAGKPVVLNFWASYCHPCREEFPLFREQLAAHPGDFVVLGIDAKDIEFAAAYGVGAVPQTFFIKPDGTVALRYYAQIPDDKWSDALAKITRPAAR